MKKRYLIMMYEQGPIGGWHSVNYSDLHSAVVYDNDGIGSLEDAQKLFELVADSINLDDPLMLVHVIRNNEIETEYK